MKTGVHGLVRMALLAGAALAVGGGCSDALDGGGALSGGDVGGMGGFPGTTGDFGATQGGVQDLAAARALVEEGQVPPPEALVVEAMYSEHDLPVTGAPCARTLCIRGAAAIAETLDGAPSAWLQLGLSSTVDPQTFERPSLALVMTVDVSGSMGWGGAGQTPGALSRQLLRAVGDRLGPDDTVAIVTYGTDVTTFLAPVPGDDTGYVDAVEALYANGSTNMEAGMRRAYDVARGLRGAADEVRLMLFTDVRPNVGATGGSEFQALAEAGAEDGVGLTVFALGLGLDSELLAAFSHLRGGNAFSLVAGPDGDEVQALMEDSWPWMVSPLAYDLAVSVQASAGFGPPEGFGFPVDAAGEAELEVATVFLSKRRGALMLRFPIAEGTEPTDLRVAGGLTYAPADGGEPVSEALDVSLRGERLDPLGRHFAQRGVQKAVALTVLVTGMREAAEAYATDRDAAVETMTATRDRFEADVRPIGDEALDAELAFAEAMLTLMKDGAPQGALYGPGR